MDKRMLASMVVKYWYLIEFLEQSDFPIQSKEGKELCLKALKGETQSRQIILYQALSFDEDKRKLTAGGPCEILKKDARDYPAYEVVSDEIEICLGKLKRHVFSDRLKQIFCEDLELPEKNEKPVCLIGLRCDREGKYIPDSLSISPLVWGVCQLSAHTGQLTKANMAEFLSITEYESDVRIFGEHLMEYEEGKQTGKLLTHEILKSLMGAVEKEYLGKLLSKKQEVNWDGVMIYRRYRSETDKLKDLDAFYNSDLANSFFTKDLYMIKDAISRGALGNTPMERAVLDYITGLYAEEMPEPAWLDLCRRVDVRSMPENENGLKDFFYSSLNVEKAPLGKWPSKFTPGLMQQLAVNLSWKLCPENQPIFSVNGPPGTGKTTLLKEIIAGNIVERAVMLMNYRDPDDAFVLQYFQDGDKRKNGYSDYCYGYYDFKDEKLKDYGMLVTSCNNAAVENITKELPDGTALVKGLDPGETEEESVRKGLLEVKSLFDLDSAEQEYYSVWNRETERYDQRKYGDIYFTKLANDLAKREEGEWDRWGLISAPFGKTSNLKQYMNLVLKPYINSFGRNKSSGYSTGIEERKSEYGAAVQRFKKQLEKVKEMEQELQKVSGARTCFIQCQQTYRNEIQNTETLRKGQLQGKTELQREIQQQEQKVKAAELACEDFLLKLSNSQNCKSQQEKMQTEVENQIQSIRQKIMELENGRRLLDVVLEFFHHPTMLSCTIRDQYEALEKAEQLLTEEKTKTAQLQQEWEERKRQYEKQGKELAALEEEKKKLIEKLQICLERIRQLEEQIENCKKEMVKAENRFQNLLKEASAQQGDLSMTVLDDEFFRRYGSGEKEASTAVQVSNPWYTQAYQREREKLFYEALKLHKAFLLASKACLWNFKNLLLMWKEPRSDEDKKVVEFSRRDKERAFGALLNTVFLLTPVLSTTFASAGNMLSSIKKTGEIGCLGCLIIDEAGQAAPQMALGSLFRCRHAVVVGDPKQVEPVVTDELDLMKQVIQNEDTGYYQSKNLSVQGFADRLNRVGTTYAGQALETWVGCPLVVHRRCISPMFEISNALSYDNMMKQQTMPPKPEKVLTFCRENSGWINVCGNENSSQDKNHFVETQGRKAWELIWKAFQLTEGMPSLFVITPFTTVRDGMKRMVRSRKEYHEDKRLAEWADKCIGTVHTFQGKEADQVIFLLGCDKNALSAVRWVNTNIVNVAVTRAKYRLYVIGDYMVWQNSDLFQRVKGILDSYALRTLQKVLDHPEALQDKGQIEQLIKEVPDADSLTVDGQLEDSLAAPLFQEMDKMWKGSRLTQEQLSAFGLTEERMNELPLMIQKRLASSILLHELFAAMRERYCIEKMDASCAGILFCKTMESMLKEKLLAKLKKQFPEEKIYKERLCSVKEQKVTTGTFTYLLNQERIRSCLASRKVQLFGEACDSRWWEGYAEKLEKFRGLRNLCCHSEPLSWEQEKELIEVLFGQQEFMKTMVGDSL